MRKKKEFKDEIDRAIHKYSIKEWGDTYQTNWEKLYEDKKYARLWEAVRNEVEGYMYAPRDLDMTGPTVMSADEAVNQLRRSRYYVSQADFYKNSIKEELVALGYNRNRYGALNYDPSHKKETFTSLTDIQYHGNIEHDGVIYQKYSFISNGVLLFYYKNRSPKDELYLEDLHILTEDWN